MKGKLAVHLISAVILLGATLAPNPAEACGGVTAMIADDPTPFGVRTASGPGGITLHVDQAGDVYVAATDIAISSALAEAIATRYLEQRYGRSSHTDDRRHHRP